MAQPFQNCCVRLDLMLPSQVADKDVVFLIEWSEILADDESRFRVTTLYQRHPMAQRST